MGTAAGALKARSKKPAPPPPPDDCRLLLAGIDTLYLSSAATSRPELVRELLALKETARECAREGLALPRWSVKLMVKGEEVLLDLEMQPGGSGKGDLLLTSDELALVVHSKPPKNLPRAYVELRALFLWSGWDRASSIGGALLGAVADPTLTVDVQVSRIDLAADFMGWQPEPDLLQHIVGRVVRRDQNFEADPKKTDDPWFRVHGYGRRFTGFTFGSGAIMCRLYDKTVEMKKSGKEWFVEKWKREGYVDEESSGHVWRLEFQVRREVLRELQLITQAMKDGTDLDADGEERGDTEVKRWEDLKQGLNDLWRYLTSSWLTYRLPRTATERNVPHPRWVTLMNARLTDLPDGELYRHQRRWSMKRCLGALGGYLKLEHALDCAERDAVPSEATFEADMHRLVKLAMKHHELRRGEKLYDAARALWVEQVRRGRMFGGTKLARANAEQLPLDR